MQRQPGTLVAERPAPADIEVVVDAAPPPVTHPGLRVWAWRALIGLAMLVALVGMFAWSSTPPT
jgi:hypothetical protein